MFILAKDGHVTDAEGVHPFSEAVTKVGSCTLECNTYGKKQSLWSELSVINEK